MPQALLNQISFDPPLPSLKNQLIQRIPMGSVIKTLTFYDHAFWREKGLNGVAIADSDSGPVQAVLDDTKPDGSHPALMG
jgi:monoamine oxidase